MGIAELIGIVVIVLLCLGAASVAHLYWPAIRPLVVEPLIALRGWFLRRIPLKRPGDDA